MPTIDPNIHDDERLVVLLADALGTTITSARLRVAVASPEELRILRDEFDTFAQAERRVATQPSRVPAPRATTIPLSTAAAPRVAPPPTPSVVTQHPVTPKQAPWVPFADRPVPLEHTRQERAVAQGTCIRPMPRDHRTRARGVT